MPPQLYHFESTHISVLLPNGWDIGDRGSWCDTRICTKYDDDSDMMIDRM